jgi:hypothetical protein
MLESIMAVAAINASDGPAAGKRVTVGPRDKALRHAPYVLRPSCRTGRRRHDG